MEKTKKVIVKSGHEITVNVSEEACAKLGVKPDEELIDPYGTKCTVIGVAPCNSTGEHIGDHDVVWFKNESGDVVRYSSKPKDVNLREVGFRRVGELEAKQKELAENGGRKIEMPDGQVVYVDVFDETCLKFGFKAGTKIEKGGIESLVLGVGPIPARHKTTGEDLLVGPEILFLETESGKIGLYSSDVDKLNLVEQGFRIVGEIKAKQEELENNGGVPAISVSGHPFFLDPSDEACESFGFKAGEEVYGPGGVYVVKGVGPSEVTSGFDCLWFQKPGNLEVQDLSDDYNKNQNLGDFFTLKSESDALQEKLKENGGVKVFAQDNHFYVDPNTVLCESLGGKPGEKVEHPYCPGAVLEIIGAAPKYEGRSGKMTLWGSCNKEIGKVCNLSVGEDEGSSIQAFAGSGGLGRMLFDFLLSKRRPF
ncbi:MAG: hypothetical protein KC516_02065 [Nanoarchaeota archaeon]|nr:hypothetical protein [Nanoarchaeota archaeon]